MNLTTRDRRPEVGDVLKRLFFDHNPIEGAVLEVIPGTTDHTFSVRLDCWWSTPMRIYQRDKDAEFFVYLSRADGGSIWPS